MLSPSRSAPSGKEAELEEGVNSDDDERQPLLAPVKRAPSTQRSVFRHPSFAILKELQVPFVTRAHIPHTPRGFHIDLKMLHLNTQDRLYHDKLLFYHYEHLLSWKVLTRISTSTLVRRPAFFAVVYTVAIAAASATTVYLFVPSASMLSVGGATSSIHDFLKFFITFMLGFYVQMSFTRWWNTVSEFKALLNDMKELIFLLIGINATHESSALMERLCIASAYVLNTEMHNAQSTSRMCPQQGEEAVHHMADTLTMLESHGLLAEEERLELLRLDEANINSVIPLTTTMWTWISAFTSDLKVESQEGPVHLSTPLSIRVLFLCQDCISNIEKLKTNVIVQIPYLYANLLSTLVFINNTIIGLSCGIALGASMAEIEKRDAQLHNLNATHATGVGPRSKYLVQELYEALQNVVLQVLYVLLEPMLYTSFLHIGMILCYPFGDEDHSLPTEAFIATVHSELLLMFRTKAPRSRQPTPRRNLRTGRTHDDIDEDDDGDDGE